MVKFDIEINKQKSLLKIYLLKWKVILQNITNYGSDQIFALNQSLYIVLIIKEYIFIFLDLLWGCCPPCPLWSHDLLQLPGILQAVTPDQHLRQVQVHEAEHLWDEPQDQEELPVLQVNNENNKTLKW